MYGTTSLLLEIPKLNVPIEYTNVLSEQLGGYLPPNYDEGTQATLCGADSSMAIGCLNLKLTNTGNRNDTVTSDNSYQPELYSLNLKDRPTFQFSTALTMAPPTKAPSSPPGTPTRRTETRPGQKSTSWTG